jgi:hypothetical protein
MSKFATIWGPALAVIYDVHGHACSVTRPGLAQPLAITLRGSQGDEDGAIGGMVPVREGVATYRARVAEIAQAAAAAGAGWQGLQDGDRVTFTDAPGVVWRVAGAPRTLPSATGMAGGTGASAEVEIRLSQQRGAQP